MFAPMLHPGSMGYEPIPPEHIERWHSSDSGKQIDNKDGFSIFDLPVVIAYYRHPPFVRVKTQTNPGEDVSKAGDRDHICPILWISEASILEEV